MLLIVTGSALVGSPTEGQVAPYAGAFARVHPEAAATLGSYEAAHAALLEWLLIESSASPRQLEGVLFDRIRERLTRVTDSRTRPMQAEMPGFSRFAPRVAGILEAAHALHRELYDIHADERTLNKNAVVGEAIDRYLSRSDVALPDRPKSMLIIDGQEHSGAFRERYPETNGLMWTAHWLEIAVHDPLMYYPAAESRREGVRAVVDRFQEMLAGPTTGFPTQMPTSAAIAPELVRRHKRAAAIFDNLHMLHGVVVDILADEGVPNKALALDEATRQFMDPDHLAASELDWMLMSLRHGIYDQGGPAIGRLTRTERNTGHVHGSHGPAGYLPGMGTPPAGPSGGSEPMPSADPDAHENHD